MAGNFSLCCASCESSFCNFRAFESFEGEVAVDTILIALVMRLCCACESSCSFHVFESFLQLTLFDC